MRSPLSAMLACILEFLEFVPFKNTKQSTYFHCIDDGLLICPRDADFPDLVYQLNKVKHIIEFI